MFGRLRTRIFIILSLTAAVLISYMGLSRERAAEVPEHTLRLDIPGTPLREEPPEPPRREPEPDPGEEEFEGALEDPGTEILLD